METPVAGLALDFASTGPAASRRSPFSPNNSVTTEWKSDPSKTNDLLKDIAKVLQSPVPSPLAGYARLLDGEFQAESSSAAQHTGIGEHSAKELVASLEKLLQKTPSVDAGQAALLTLRASPTPLQPSPKPQSASSPSPEPPRVLERLHSRWQFLATKAASFKSPAASPSASPATSPSVAALLDQISSVASPPASAAASPAASPRRTGLLKAGSLWAGPAPGLLDLNPCPDFQPRPRDQHTAPETVGGYAAGGGAGAGPSLSLGTLPPGLDTRAGAALAAAGLLPAPARPPQGMERVVLHPVRINLKPPGGYRFQQQAAQVVGELAAFATLESTTSAQFRASIAEQLSRLFTLPS